MQMLTIKHQVQLILEHTEEWEFPRVVVERQFGFVSLKT